MFSREYLYREVVIRNHCICLHLKTSIPWDGQQLVDDIFVRDIICSEAERELLVRNILNEQNTEGKLTVKAFYPSVSDIFTPIEERTKTIEISTTNIYELEKLQ